MEIAHEDGREIMQHLVDEQGQQYPPRLAQLSLLALTAGDKEVTSYCIRDSEDARTTWTILGVTEQALFYLVAQAQAAHWSLDSDSDEGELIRAEVHPIDDIDTLSLLSTRDMDRMGRIFQMRSVWQFR